MEVPTMIVIGLVLVYIIGYCTDRILDKLSDILRELKKQTPPPN